jgi:hypothetical protein
LKELKIGATSAEQYDMREACITYAFMYNSTDNARSEAWSGRAVLDGILKAHAMSKGMLDWGRSLPAN